MTDNGLGGDEVKTPPKKGKVKRKPERSIADLELASMIRGDNAEMIWELELKGDKEIRQFAESYGDDIFSLNYVLHAMTDPDD